MAGRAGLYRVGEVATLTRVSVRTLHHYDRIGLLRPSALSAAGYRLYAGPDLLRLQQILTLRYLGFPLKQIGELLARPDFDLVAALRIQRRILQDRIAELGRIEATIGELVRRWEAGGQWDWELAGAASAEVGRGLEQRKDAMEHYYTPEQMERFAALRAETDPAEIAAIEQGWTALLADVRAAREGGLDPESAQAWALADRWDALTERTANSYRSEPGLWRAIGETYERGAFEGHDKAPQAADFAFIERVKQAR
jgi:MerR family transcriptional regulator, thiopeptide resistance regulator